jgi:hypothetical protein
MLEILCVAKLTFHHSVNIHYDVQQTPADHCQPVIPRKLLTMDSKFHVLYTIPVN